MADRAECLREALATYLAFPVSFPTPPVDLGNGAFTLHDVELQVGEAAGPPGKILSLDVFAFDCAGYRANGTPSLLKLSASHVSVPAAQHPLVGLLPGFAGDEDDFGLAIDLAYEPTKMRVTLNQADLDFGGLAIAFSLDVSNVDLKDVRITSGGLMALGGAAALQGSLHWLDLTLWNKSGNRLLEAFARGKGKTMVQQRDDWLRRLDDMMEGEDNVAAVPILRELKVFVQDLRKLRVRMQPPDGHIELVVLGSTADKGEQIHLLGLTVEANK